MSHPSSIFSRTPIELPNRSGFDMSHENLGTQTCGTLVPVLVDELLPNDTISLGANFQVQLPPMATDFYCRVDYVLEAFFVPARLLWGGWKSFMTHPTANPIYPAQTPTVARSKYMPKIRSTVGRFGPGTLADYLGFKISLDIFSPDTPDDEYPAVALNALPFLAYHRIWDDWYRDSRIQTPLFFAPDSTVPIANLTGANADPSYSPYVAGGVDSPYFYDEVEGKGVYFYDNVKLSQLRQRNWAKDYFTSASPLPQAGNAATL